MTKINRKEIKEHAFVQTKKFFWPCCIIGLIGLIISVGSSFIPTYGIIISSVLGGIIAIGRAAFDLKVARDQDADVKDLIQSGNLIFKSILVHLLMILKIFLWTLLLVIPGILKAFSYAMAHQVLVDNPDMKVTEVLRRSEELMYGRRWELFVMYLSFIGWFLLSMITLGIGLIFVVPYTRIACAQFYIKLTSEHVYVITGNNPNDYEVKMVDTNNPKDYNNY